MKYIVHFLLTIFLVSCLQDAPVSNVQNQNSNIENNSNPTETAQEDIGTKIGSVNFFQLGTTKSTNQLSAFADYSDSILLRGNDIHNFISSLSSTSSLRLCAVFKYPGSSSKDILVLAARARSFLNVELGGVEHFLQMEVNNETANFNDCLTVDLQNTINTQYSSSNIAYKLTNVCPSCNANILSSSMNLFYNDGQQSTLLSNHLSLQIIPALGNNSTSNTNTGLSCTEDQLCKSGGFNCCVVGQCVNHGQVKTGVNTSTNEYQNAIAQILNNPNDIVNYQSIFHICPEFVSSSNDDQVDPIDPSQLADDLFNELEDLYRCVNPVIDEFSICTHEEAINTSTLGSGGNSFTIPSSDITFNYLNPSLAFENIVNVNYGGINIFNTSLYSTDVALAFPAGVGLANAANDDIKTAQVLQVDYPIPANALSENIKIRYRVDGTCEKLGSNIAKCTKFYVQGQDSTPKRSSDHTNGDQSFKIPVYANTSYNLIVKVGGIITPPGTNTWTLATSATYHELQFTQTIYPGQDVSIQYFVTTYIDSITNMPVNVSSLTYAKELAQTKIDDHCNCEGDVDCNIKPVYQEVNGSQKITNYECVYPQPDVPEPALQETVYVNAKSVPHRFYDVNGVHYEKGLIGNGGNQEGNLFGYTAGNVLKPNNQNTNIGFNEIYGSFDKQTNSAMPASVLTVDKGKQYDLFVDEGAFSTCLNCGTDYFSSVQQLFPSNFLHKGGGYLPDPVESHREENRGKYSGDNMKFGRACFVPATMIPWTHQSNADIPTQRNNRQDAQHFLFANGYNKDWYGFDYGALIGSFDGVNWFAIGNQRRIQAKTNKLYIAINAYFGDLTINNTFKVTVSEISAVLYSGSEITHNTDSDGAQCQRYHYCSTDNDCITQLGYEYSCENVASLYTPWPQFDSNGNEISGETVTSLLSLHGGSNGQVKRCVYRGAGAICAENLIGVNAGNSHLSSNRKSLHTCSANTYCESLSTANFNTKIARYGSSAATQNNQSYITNDIGFGDTFGLGTRVLGRPFDFYGSNSTPTDVLSQLTSLNVNALCIPGKDVEGSSSLQELNSTMTTARDADKINNIGNTYTGLQDPSYFAGCPATDSSGVFTFKNENDLNILLSTTGTNKHNTMAITQNLSTNSLDLSGLNLLNIFNDDTATTIRKGIEKNSCLRAPGASCFSNFDCAPSKYIATKIKSISDLSSVLNPAEEKFWEEDLVCSNTQEKYPTASIYPTIGYDLTTHHCCREVSKDFTYTTARKDGDFDVVVSDADRTPLIPGLNQDINDPRRYSRTHTVYDKISTDSAKYPSLYHAPMTPINGSPFNLAASEIKQYNTLHLNNSRMCCTNNWVRKFASENGGGHRFDGQKQQIIKKENLKTLSWGVKNNSQVHPDADPNPYMCNVDDYPTSDCEIKNYIAGSSLEKKWLDWLGKLELIGIPQVLIETNQYVYRSILDEYLDTDISSGASDQENTGMRLGLPGTIANIVNGTTGVTLASGAPGIADVSYGGKEYYSAASYENFKLTSNATNSGSMKKVFSEDEFACCIPTGVEIDPNTSDINNKCCSGQANTIETGQTVCCLNDYTDLSVYTNRYVSSEGAQFNGQPLLDSDVDPLTGYIRPEIVLQMAPTMCCSGQASQGVAIGDYFIPIEGGIIPDAKSRRFLYNDTTDNAVEVNGAASYYDQGLKWNTHVYCIPAGSDDSSGSGGTSVISE